jgi:hypothetical protein
MKAIERSEGRVETENLNSSNSLEYEMQNDPSNHRQSQASQEEPADHRGSKARTAARTDSRFTSHQFATTWTFAKKHQAYSVAQHRCKHCPIRSAAYLV